MADKKPLVNNAGNAVEIATGDTIPIANGGTGATTANAALNALLPSQTGNSGKALVTDGTDASWDALSLPSSFVGMSIAKFKTASQSVASSTTLVDCTGMSFAIGANEVWMGQWIPAWEAGTSGGIKWAVTLPSGCVGRSRGVNGSTTDGFASNDVDITAGGGRTAAYNITVSHVLFFNITNGSTAGTVQFQFAQNASNGTNTTISKNAQLIAWRVS